MIARVSRAIRIGLALVAATSGVVLLPGCEISNFMNPCGSDGCQPARPQDCSALPSLDWAVDGLLAAPEAQVAVGSSFRSSLTPFVEDHCIGSVAGVDWSVEDPAVAALTPSGRAVWITGLTTGVTSVGARIRFSGGAERLARPRTVRVVPTALAPAGSLAQGRLTIPPYVPPGGTDNWRGWVTFATTATGRVDVIVDWGSPLNKIDFSGYEGRCSAIGQCGRILMTAGDWDVKPRTGTFDLPRLPPGEYTIRFDNLGPEEETVLYEVRLTPQ